MSHSDDDLEGDLDEEDEDEQEDREECAALKPLYAAIRADDTDAAILAISDILANPATTCDMYAAPGTSLFSAHFHWILYGLDEHKTALSLACAGRPREPVGRVVWIDPPPGAPYPDASAAPDAAESFWSSR